MRALARRFALVVALAALPVATFAAGAAPGEPTARGERSAHGEPATGADRRDGREAEFAPGWREHGRISYYGREFASKTTASGEPFDPEALTMAHRSLPFGSLVRVKSLRNGRTVVVRVNDRGPYEKGRIADLSRAAARKLGMLRHGVVRGRIELLRVGGESAGDAAAP